MNNGKKVIHFEDQICRIISDIHIANQTDILLPNDPDPTKRKCRRNEYIRAEVARLGLSIDEDDVKYLVTLYIYINYYAWPHDDLLACKDSHKTPRDETKEPVNNITYEKATGLRIDYWVDKHWNYAKPEHNFDLPTTQVVRKGSQGQWVGNGEYVETSLNADDDDPTLSVHQRTHAFAPGSRIGNYNWIYGKYPSDDDNKGGVRFYFHLKPLHDSAALLVREIQKGFDLYEIPFAFKFLAFAEDYECRADTAILYVSRKHLHVVIYLLADIYKYFNIGKADEIPVLNTQTPQFAYPLLPDKGIAFAEDPENNDSFGQSRCKLLAEALFGNDEADETERIKAVINHLECKGFDNLDEFYKNPHSPTDYTFFFNLFKQLTGNESGRQSDDLRLNGHRRINIRLSDEAEWFGQPGIYRRKYLVATVRIAIRLCKEAVWYPVDQDQSEWRCNWLSYQPFDTPKGGYAYRLLPPEGPVPGTGASSVKSFLNEIYNDYYDAEVFKSTTDRIDLEGEVYNEFVGPDFSDWKDYDIRLAWAYLYLEEYRNKIITNLRKRNVKDFIAASRLTKGQVERLADFIIKKFLDAGRPLGNGYETRDPKARELFCANERFGLAGLGRFFLKVYELKPS